MDVKMSKKGTFWRQTVDGQNSVNEFRFFANEFFGIENRKIFKNFNGGRKRAVQ